VAQLVSALYCNVGEWTSDLCEEVLLFAQVEELQLITYERQPEIVAGLLGLLERIDAGNECAYPPCSRLQVVQLLSTIGFSGTEAFWLQQMQVAPADYLNLAFTSLLLETDVDTAFNLLAFPGIEYSEAMLAGIAMSLLIDHDENQIEVVEAALTRHRESLPPSVVARIDDCCRRHH
jgi:hypothetical protein